MKKLRNSAIVLTIATAFVLYSCDQSNDTMHDSKSGAVVASLTKDSLIKRGGYLVMTMGCNDCHSPKKMGPHGPEPDPNLLLSGHPAGEPLAPVPNSPDTKNWLLFSQDVTAFVGPWGTSFAANLTSDPTGIGGWTLERFSKAFRGGVYNGIDGARPVLPPMPTPSFAHVNDQDLLAIFTYLQSTKPVKNLVPQAIPPGGPVKS